LLEQRGFALEVLGFAGLALNYFPAFQGDEEMVLTALAHDPAALRHADAELRSSKAFALKAVCLQGLSLEHFADCLQADREVVLSAVSQNGEAFEFASEACRDDEDLALAACHSHHTCFASARLRSDEDWALRAVGIDYRTMAHVDLTLTSKHDFLLKALAVDGRAMEFLPEDCQGEKDLVLWAGAQHPSALEFASVALLKQVSFLELQREAATLRRAADIVRKHPSSRNMVLRAVAIHPLSLWHASDDLKCNAELKAQMEWFATNQPPSFRTFDGPLCAAPESRTPRIIPGQVLYSY